jgi:phospholipid transport system transporter-binding protein
MAAALTGELSFGTVAAELAKLRDAAHSGAGVFELDLSGVTRVDSAGLALLLELARLARAAGRELRLTGAPEQLRRLAGFFALSPLLALPA